MSFIVYFDEDAQRNSLIEHIRRAGIVTTSVNEQHTASWTDEEQLIFSASKGWSIYTFNIEDFREIHSRWMLDGKRHCGIIVADQLGSSVKEKAKKLAALVLSRSAEQMRNQLDYLSS